MSAPAEVELKLKTAVSLLREVEQDLQHIDETLDRAVSADSDPDSFVISAAVAMGQAVKQRLAVGREASDIRSKLDQVVSLAKEVGSASKIVTVDWDGVPFTPDVVVAAAHYLRGKLATGLGDSKTALEWFQNSLKTHENPGARQGIGLALVVDGDPQKAAEAFQTVINRHPESEEAVEALKIIPRLRSVRQRNRNVALALALLGGWLGADRFYLGFWGWGFIKLFTFGGFFVLWGLDLLRILSGGLRDARGWRLSP